MERVKVMGKEKRGKCEKRVDGESKRKTQERKGKTGRENGEE